MIPQLSMLLGSFFSKGKNLARSEFSVLFTIYTLYLASHYMGWELIFLFFLKQGVGFTFLALFYLVFSVTQLVVLFIFKKLFLRESLVASFVLRMLMFGLALFFFHNIQLILIGILWGVMLQLFWIPYYNGYYNYSGKGNTAQTIGKITIIDTILKMIMPVLGGLIALVFGFRTLFIICIVLLGATAVFSWQHLDSHKAFRCSVRRSLRNFDKLQLVSFVEGLWQTIPFMIVPLATMLFITDELGYGAFLSYLSILMIIGLRIMSRISDKLHNRELFLYPLAVVLSVVTIISGISLRTTIFGIGPLFWWTLSSGLMILVWKLTETISMSIVVEKSTRLQESLFARRFLIALGRTLGSVFTVLVLIFFGKDALGIPLVLLGLLFLSYPFLFYREHIYKYGF